MKRIAIGIALISASTMGLTHASYAMSLPAPSALKQAVPSHTSQVYWRGGGWGPGIGFGIAAGVLTAAALATRPYWGGGYWGGYPGYAYAPAYGYAPAYSYAYDRPMDTHPLIRTRMVPVIATAMEQGIWARVDATSTGEWDLAFATGAHGGPASATRTGPAQDTAVR